jgi:hypothetical protein
LSNLESSKLEGVTRVIATEVEYLRAIARANAQRMTTSDVGGERLLALAREIEGRLGEGGQGDILGQIEAVVNECQKTEGKPLEAFRTAAEALGD